MSDHAEDEVIESEALDVPSDGVQESDTIFGDIVYAPGDFKAFFPQDPDRPDVIRKRGIVWGGHDLVGDTFDRETDLGRSRSFVGMPVYYDHAQRGVKSEIGKVIAEEEDEEGIVFDIELHRNRSYREDVLRLEREQALGASTGTASHLIVRKGGKLKRWIVAELSLSPTPAEPRTLAAVKSVDTKESFKMDEQTVTALQDEVKELRTELDELKSLPAVEAAKSLGGKLGGGFQRTDGVRTYANMKAYSYFGSPTRQEQYPAGIFGGFVKALFDRRVGNASVHERATKAITDIYGGDFDSDAAKALGTASGAAGGVLLPEQFVPMLLQVDANQDALYGRAMVIPVEGGDIVIPALDQGGTYVEGQDQMYGGTTVVWGDDDAAATATQPSFAQVKLKTNSLKAYTPVQNGLLRRSAISIDGVVTTVLGGAVQRARDYVMFRGNGVSRPLGVLNAPALIDVAGSAIDFATILGMLERTIPSRADNYVWYCHPFRMSDVIALQQTNNSLVTFLPDLRGKPGTQLLGRPLIYTDKIPYASGDVSNSLLLVDPTAVVAAEFQGVMIDISDQALFTSDQTVFRVILSMDSQPWLKSKIAIGSGADENVSAYISI